MTDITDNAIVIDSLISFLCGKDKEKKAELKSALRETREREINLEIVILKFICWLLDDLEYGIVMFVKGRISLEKSRLHREVISKDALWAITFWEEISRLIQMVSILHEKAINELKSNERFLYKRDRYTNLRAIQDAFEEMALVSPNCYDFDACKILSCGLEASTLFLEGFARAVSTLYSGRINNIREIQRDKLLELLRAA